MCRLGTAVIGIVAAALFAPGCGGSNSDTATTEVTKAQFIKRAEAICAEAKKNREAEIARWEMESGVKPTEVDLDEGLKDVVAPSLDKEAEELAALTLPRAVEASLERMIAKLSKASAILAKEGEKGITRSRIDQFEREATNFGLKGCSPL
jgi:hypothetical protein